MRLRNVKNAKLILEESPYIIKEPREFKGKYNILFKNNNPICIEIGMGKGNFIIGMAKKYPNINYIGIEKYESVQVRAIQKLKDEKIDNLLLINEDAINLTDIFDHEIDTIYLNFSDPWPKTRHEKRRLTSNTFIPIYESISKNKVHIIQKTDNISLFQYSLVNLSQNGFKFNKVFLDLHTEEEDNILTEYEEKFQKMGEKINYLDAVK